MRDFNENGQAGDENRSEARRDGKRKRFTVKKEGSTPVSQERKPYASSERSAYSERSERSFNNDRPYRSDRPQRSYDGGERGNYNQDRSRPSYGGGERSGGYNQDRPRPSYGGGERSGGYNQDRPRPSYGGGERSGGYNQDRPRPSYGGGERSGGYNQDRPRPSYGGGERSGGYNQDRPRPSYGGGERSGGYNQDRPRPSYGGGERSGGYNQDRPRPSYGGGERSGGYNQDRPRRPYSGGGDRPQGGGYNRGGQGRGNSGGFKRQNDREYNPNDKYSQRKQIEYKETHIDPNAPIRLNKYLSNAGVCSRREADEFIKAGVVSVNGEVVNELGHKVMRSDKVLFHDQLIKLEKKVYVLLNKPKNCVTTSDDPEARLTVLDLVKGACNERIYPVGRLDRNTTGVLLLTNDGEMAAKLAHPKFNKKKIYHVFLDKEVSEEDLLKIAEGVELSDGVVHADAISYATDTDKDQVGIEIHSGKNRVVRRIFDVLGYRVTKLDRVLFAGLTKKNLRRGQWRYLSEDEVNMLRMGAYE